ncbi:class I SAM-dependent RNA methyltransferase [Pacificibacter marinus]|uniref:23S rRNA (Uracil(1939)-C(5))-methyltransferase RlmD n=1 Tax=Pacificibacter marinus TaxID=658057 RepID=A0A1Y5T4L8_9RHOB|nr:class I SAM-dependent RNA methyltransferase [Pacificibacter marinus]SEL02862.1 23S rRNA m(5)U-1939 methyltransferase [Pacificibacter marinus]SLN52236.1 23S rRNA (uracil(1939)-C(5))-methyltransferase RlmD [Pacificibacter marinus]
MTQIEITRLGHHGDGIADGPIFAAKTLPGEIVEGSITGDRMIDPRIVSPSPNRVRPPCVHFKACGGCALQHASDDFVATWKADVVRTALSHQGVNVPVSRIVTSPARSRRRAVFAGRRTKKGVLVGLHGRASGTLVAIPECILMTPKIMQAMPAFEALVHAGGSRRGEMAITVTDTDAGLDVSVIEAKPLDLDLRTELASVVRQYGLIRLSWNGDEVAQETRPYLNFGRARLVPPPGAFLQATKHGEMALVALMKEAVFGAGRVVDLFSGCGTFALPLSEVAEVHAVESEAMMLQSLSAAWKTAPGLKVVTTQARDLFRQPLLPDELKRFDAAIIDPPRAGALAQTGELAKSNLRSIGFVSCNPVTFARDAKILVDSGFQIDWIKVVDQFRWSPHVEIAARFYRT